MRGQLTAHHIKPDYANATEGSARFDQVFARINRAITSVQVARAVVEGGRFLVGARSGALVELTPDRRDVRVQYAVGDATRNMASETLLPLTTRFPLCDVVRSRQELWLTNPEELVECYPDTVPADGSSAWAVLPLLIDGVILGAVGWSFRNQWLSSYRRASLRSLAEAAGIALYRAGLFDSERSARMKAELGSYDVVRQDRMMAEVGSTLDTVADVDNVSAPLDQVAHLALPRLGEWCSVHVLDDQGRLRQIAATHSDPQKEHLLHRFIPPSTSSGGRLPRRLHRGKPLVLENLSAEQSRGTGLSQRHIQVLRMVGLERLLAFPLRIHHQTLGTIWFGTGNPARTYSAADVAVAERVARRCAAFLEYMRLRDSAERANQARDEFVAATSHELRTPLSHIKGFVSTLRTTDAAWDTQTRDDFLAEIEQEADRLTSLVETLLDLSRIDSHGLDPVHRQPTTPAALVAAGVGRIRHLLGDRPLDIQAPDDLPQVWADGSHLERAIANLLDNAGKYSPPHEPITVVARASRRFVVFRVEDRGLGIPSEHLERIFEPFFREPTGPYPAKPGTGLGLAICRSIIRSHRGRIWAEQRQGGGAVLAFTLPIVAASQRT